MMNASCVCCGNPDYDEHHIKTRKSGGGDERENLLDLCRLHHIEIHKIGMTKMIRKFPVIQLILKEKGWEYCETRKKWVR